MSALIAEGGTMGAYLSIWLRKDLRSLSLRVSLGGLGFWSVEGFCCDEGSRSIGSSESSPWPSSSVSSISSSCSSFGGG